jgi:hypothetical protein
VLVKSVILGGFVAITVLGCRHADTEPPAVAATCTESNSFATYRVRGKALVGDVNADGTGDRVTLRVDARRPPRCRHLLVSELAGAATAVARVPPLSWPGTDPRLLLLAEIDGRPGVEPVVAMSPAAVYRPGAVFALRKGALVRMRLEKASVPGLFPFADEFPAGVDCAGPPGTIVVTQGRLADGSDSRYDVTRSFYRAAGTRFSLARDEHFQVGVGNDARQRWPEVRGDPFIRCSGRVS